MAARSAFRFISRAAAAVLLLALLLAGGGLYWLGTQHGLEWIARQAVTAAEGRLALEGVQGSLYGRISISRAAFKDAGLDIAARDVVLEWRPQALLRREARITSLAIDDLRIAIPASDPAKPPQLPATLRLPLNTTLADARVNRIEFAPGQVVRNLHFSLNARSNAHSLELVKAETLGWRAAGTLRLDAAAPFAAAGKLELEGKAQGEPLKVRVTVGGNLDALEVQASTSARGASAKAAGLLHPFSELPLGKFTLDADNIDLASWDKALPRTRIVIALEAAMPASDRFTGTARAKNDIPGLLDAQRLPLSRAALAFAGSGSRWSVSDIDIGVGKSGRVRGSGSIGEAGVRLELALADIVSAELHGRLQPLTVSGRVIVTGDAKAQQLTARLEGAGAKLELAARHAEQVITVERGELRAQDGQLDFTGRAALTANREFEVNAAFSGLDPARFIAAPPARLNGKVSASGMLAPDWQAQVRLAITDSRFRGQPLAANADFTTSARQLFSGEARAALAGNHLNVSGRFGEQQDKLKWSLDASNLKAIDATLSGNVQAQGTLAGSLDQPAVEFKLTARGLAAGDIAAASIEAEGAMHAGADGALSLSARITGIKTRAATLDEFKLDARGTRLRHEITAALRGANIDASLNGAGGLDESWRWNGSLAALEARGRFSFKLTAPVRISAGRGLLVIEDLRVAALGGAIGPVAVRVEEGQITTRGTVNGITAKALLALAQPTQFDPRDFTIGGHWDFALAETVSGFAEIRRETGDLGLKTERNLLLGLHKLQLRVTAQSNALDAVLDAQSTHMGMLAARVRTRLERRDSVWTLSKDAPLDGNVTLEMQSLAWVRALAPQLDQIGGRIAAQLTLAGTAGTPLITGNASADGVQVRAIGPGLNLTDGTLRASLDGRNLKVSKFYLKAGDGKIEADGTADLSDGLRSLDITARAERARILDSPQLTVILSGTGRAGLRDLKLALDGKFKIDEGSYDLGAERKPELGDDVVVAGHTPEAAGAKPMRTMLDLTVDLNENFKVRGHGLDAVLGGSLRIATRGEALHAIGTIRTVRGEYFAFGQLLDIQRGELSFSGPLGNPGLDLRAARKIKTVEVGVEVSGSLARPVVNLVSDPVMSDSDRLGWLILGRDPQTASTAELAILQAAALTTGTRRTTPVQKQIAAGLGLDEFGVSGGDGSGALGVLALGKRISERLTVRLEQSLGGTAGGLLKIDYLLSQRWRLEGTAGAESAADILFTLRFD